MNEQTKLRLHLSGNMLSATGLCFPLGVLTVVTFCDKTVIRSVCL